MSDHFDEKNLPEKTPSKISQLLFTAAGYLKYIKTIEDDVK